MNPKEINPSPRIRSYILIFLKASFALRSANRAIISRASWSSFIRNVNQCLVMSSAGISTMFCTIGLSAYKADISAWVNLLRIPGTCLVNLSLAPAFPCPCIKSSLYCLATSRTLNLYHLPMPNNFFVLSNKLELFVYN
ncbi:hypothetical protein D9M73_198880 [compost metagenome]